MKVVHIEWIDSQTEIGWESVGHVPPEPEITHTVGFLIHEGEHYLVVANSYDPATHETNGRIVIPQVSVIGPVTQLCIIKTS